MTIHSLATTTSQTRTTKSSINQSLRWCERSIQRCFSLSLSLFLEARVGSQQQKIHRHHPIISINQNTAKDKDTYPLLSFVQAKLLLSLRWWAKEVLMNHDWFVTTECFALCGDWYVFLHQQENHHRTASSPSSSSFLPSSCFGSTKKKRTNASPFFSSKKILPRHQHSINPCNIGKTERRRRRIIIIEESSFQAVLNRNINQNATAIAAAATTTTIYKLLGDSLHHEEKENQVCCYFILRKPKFAIKEARERGRRDTTKKTQSYVNEVGLGWWDNEFLTKELCSLGLTMRQDSRAIRLTKENHIRSFPTNKYLSLFDDTKVILNTNPL